MVFSILLGQTIKLKDWKCLEIMQGHLVTLIYASCRIPPILNLNEDEVRIDLAQTQNRIVLYPLAIQHLWGRFTSE